VLHDLSQAFAQYRERWPQEASTCDRFEKLLHEWPACLDRAHMPGHLTSSAWVVDPSGTAVILTHHRKLNVWVQLGGHADGEQDLPNVARREVAEESGVVSLRQLVHRWFILDADVHRIPPYQDVPEHFHYDMRFVFMAEQQQELQISDESHDVQWVPLTALPEYSRERSMVRMADKWRQIRNSSPGLFTSPGDAVY
jgi:8-oxo-dGTP pyrophosphatase MutT (NUDIX family)